MIRYRYNTQLQPPAPFIHLLIRNPADASELSNVPAQLDTAADRTVLPQELVKKLGLAQMGTMLIGGLGGITYTLPTYVSCWSGSMTFLHRPLRSSQASTNRGPCLVGTC